MKLLILICSYLMMANGYKILCVLAVPSKSHDFLGKGLVYALLEAGHQVTWVTSFEKNLPATNLRVIHTQFERNVNMRNPRCCIFNAATMATETLKHVLVREQFDAVVTEWIFSDVDAGYAAVQQVPWILFSTTMMHPHFEHLTDEVRSVPTIPLWLDYSVPMTFKQRLHNTFVYLCSVAMRSWDTSTVRAVYEKQYGLLAEARGQKLPPYEDAYNNISILLLNSHPVIATVHSRPPNVVDIGGFHIEEAAPLPDDLQNLLDDSPQGVIFFSLGSIIQTALIPELTIKSLQKAFESLNLTVLYKIDSFPGDLPKHMHWRRWWPQTSILAHPNTRLLVTQGGLLSTMEALHFGIPILCCPFYIDQVLNCRRSLDIGFAKVVDAKNRPEDFKGVLDEMLRNESYYERAKYLSQIFRKRAVSPRKLISHYVELAIESKGANHLRSLAFQYPWYQRWMLDQVAILPFIIVGLVAMLWVMKTVIVIMWRSLRAIPRTIQKILQAIARKIRQLLVPMSQVVKMMCFITQKKRLRVSRNIKKKAL